MSNTYPEFFFSFSCSTKESVKAIGNKTSGWTSGELIIEAAKKYSDFSAEI